MPRAVAINVGANGTLPGFRGPVYPDGSAVYVPIPEREPVAEPVPTYADLELPIDVPEQHRDTPVHLDPEFAEYPRCERHTYGDEHGVKAAPLLELSAGDLVAFYATLRTVEHGAGDAAPPQPLDAFPGDAFPAGGERGSGPDERAAIDDGAGSAVADGHAGAAATDGVADWRPPSWGAYVIGAFRLARDPIDGAAYEDLPASERELLANNAHVKRETVDASVFLVGDPEHSGLLDPVVPLSRPSGGAEANAIVTALSADSGKGPWWRRPLRFDATATDALLALLGDPVA